MRIKGYDITGKWSIDKYSIQKGDFVRFYVDIKDDYKIKWKFSDGTSSKEKIPEHMFCLKDYDVKLEGSRTDNKLSDIPCESYVWVKAKIYLKNKIIRLKRKLLVIPKINGEIRVVTEQVDDNGTVLTIIKGAVIMYPPAKPTPFQKCKELIYIPEVEIKCADVKESYKLVKYGSYKFSTMCMVAYPNSSGAINYFKYNYPEKYGKRPHLVTKYIYIPENISLSSIQYPVDTNITLELVNISQDMLPKKSLIKWHIDGNNYCNKKTKLCYKFKKSKIYDIVVIVFIPNCPPIIIEQSINVI